MKFKATITGYLNCPEYAEEFQVKTIHARTRIGLYLKYFYIWFFYDYVEVEYETQRVL